MRDFVVSCVQLQPEWLSPLTNRERIADLFVQARKQHGADLVVFPELALTGYITDRDRQFGERFILASEKIPGPTTDLLCALAKDMNAHVIVGMSELHPVIPSTLYNSAVLIGPEGIIGVHRKAHIPGEEKHYFGRGNSIRAFDTELGSIGIAICYDSQFPELIRRLALDGAEVLCMLWNMPTFSNPPELLEHITVCRAAENRMYAVSCNRVGVDGTTEFFGRSLVVDPVGKYLAKAPDSEEAVISATLCARVLREERAFQPVFSDRRPDLYSDLSKTT